MSDMHDNFDSSDIEVPGNGANTRFGASSLSKLFECRDEDRIASKIAYKSLEYSIGAPGTRYRQSLWTTRFEFFQEHTLRQDTKATFSEQDLSRFLHCIIGDNVSSCAQWSLCADKLADKLEAKDTRKTVPSESTLINGMQILVAYGKFTWKNFSLDNRGLKLKAVIDQAVQDKRLIRGQYRDRTWLGFTTVSRLVRLFLEDAKLNGTLNWDLTVAKCLSVVLVAGLGIRSGDAALSSGYTEEFMRWEDIEITLTGNEPSFDSCQADVVIKYSKGCKDVLNKDYRHHLVPLGENQSHMCLLRWIFAHCL